MSKVMTERQLHIYEAKAGAYHALCDDMTMLGQRIAVLEGTVAGLLAAAKAALGELSGENLMGGCAACGSTRSGKHANDCIVVNLRAAITAAEKGGAA